MKKTALRTWTVVGLSALVAATGYRAMADEAATATHHDKCYTGTVASVNAPDHTLRVRGFLLGKQFNLGEQCPIALADKTAGTAADLRPGQKVRVSYSDASGVLVADRIQQIPLRYTGMIKTINPETRQVTLHHKYWDKTFALGKDCRVMLRGDKAGTLADLQPGYHVTVLYEQPAGRLTARQIDQTSAMFTGELTALDLTARTVKAKRELGGTRQFNLADDCAIVIHGKPDGRMRDLRPGEKLMFNYDEVNGVSVVTRIAPVETPAPAMTAQAAK